VPGHDIPWEKIGVTDTKEEIGALVLFCDKKGAMTLFPFGGMPVAVLAAVHRDLVEKLLDERALLGEFDVCERVGAERDRLIEAVLAAVRDVDDLDDDVEEARVHEIRAEESLLELGRPIATPEDLGTFFDIHTKPT
jgi:hypothetical protein